MVVIKATKSCVAKEIKEDEYTKAVSKSKEVLEDLVSKIDLLAHRIVKAINYAEKRQKTRKTKGFLLPPPAFLNQLLIPFLG